MFGTQQVNAFKLGATPQQASSFPSQIPYAPATATTPATGGFDINSIMNLMMMMMVMVMMMKMMTGMMGTVTEKA